jgi:mono/diheme cytochrome c family protein
MLRCRVCLWACAGVVLCLLFVPGTLRAQGDVTRGGYLVQASGGCRCHTDTAQGAQPLAGGCGLKTPFGIFYSTNITPDRETGIGAWSDEDFLRAMREGLAPDGSHYFPVFPYGSFSGMTTADLLDIKAWLFAQPAVHQVNTPHAVWPPFGWRWTIGVWKRISLPYPRPVLPPAQAGDPQVRRGAYLVNAVAHCAECHTPRNLAGGLKAGWFMAGSADGPEGELAPNITPDAATGIGDWSAADLRWLMQTGFLPDGDDVQGLMAELIEHGYSKLTPEDMNAIVAYLQTIPPIENRVSKD